MTAFTSTQTGDWDNAATWGGGGTPSAGTDTAVIADGHTVTFDQALVNTIRDVTINAGGILIHEALMTIAGRLSINGTLWQKSGSKIYFEGDDNATHGLWMENVTTAHYIAQGSDGMPTTKTDVAANIGDIKIDAVDASKFAAGEWICLYALDNTSTEGDYDHSRYEDEGVWIHSVNNNDIYFRHFVGPDDVTLAEDQVTSASQIEVTNSKVFRVGEKIIWGTGQNINVAKIGTINYNTNIMTLIVHDHASNAYSIAGTNAAGTFVYKTGFEKPHRNGSRVRKCATVTTVARAATDTTITVAQDEKFEQDDIIVIECPLQTAGSTSNRNWNNYETRHVVQSRSSNTLTLTAQIGYTVPIGAVVTRLTRDIEVGVAGGIADSSNIGFFYAEHYSSNYNRSLVLKDVFFNKVGNNNSNFYSGFTIRGYFSTNDLPITPEQPLAGNYQPMSTEPWIEGCTVMINGNGRRDYSGMWGYDARNSCFRACTTSNGQDGFTIHWDPSQRIYNCFAIQNSNRCFRIQGTHYNHEVGYCYGNRGGGRGIYYEPVYNPGRGTHDIIMNVINTDPIRINRHTGYSGNMWKIDVKDSLFEGPYMSEVGHGDFTILNSRFRPIEYTSRIGTLRQSGSSYAGRQGYNSQNAIARVIEADFEYDNVISYGVYIRYIWIPEEGAYLINRDFHSNGARATVKEFFYVPANTTVRVRFQCKPTTGFAGTEPNAFIHTPNLFEDFSVDGGDPWGGNNEGASLNSVLSVGQNFASFESNTGYQTIDLTIDPVAFGRTLTAGVGTHSSDAREGFYMKPLEIYFDNMPVHRDMLHGNSTDTSRNAVRYGTSHGAVYRRWGGTV